MAAPRMAALAAAYPQGDSNPCLQDENLIYENAVFGLFSVSRPQAPICP